MLTLSIHSLDKPNEWITIWNRNERRESIRIKRYTDARVSRILDIVRRINLIGDTRLIVDIIPDNDGHWYRIQNKGGLE